MAADLPSTANDAGADSAEEADVERETETIAGLFARLVDDVERFVRAEFRLYRAQLFDRMRQGRLPIIALVAAFIIAQGAGIGLIVWLVLAVAQALGTAWALVIVIGGSLLLTVALALWGIGRLARLTDISDGPQ